jgi:virginiamycin B lyase
MDDLPDRLPAGSADSSEPVRDEVGSVEREEGPVPARHHGWSPIRIASLLAATAIVVAAGLFLGLHAFGIGSKGAHLATTVIAPSPSSAAQPAATLLPMGAPADTLTAPPSSTPSGSNVLAATLYLLTQVSGDVNIQYLTVGPDGEPCFTWESPVPASVQTSPPSYTELWGLGCISAQGAVQMWNDPDQGEMTDVTAGGGYLWVIEIHGSGAWASQWTTAGQHVADFPLPAGPVWATTWSDGDLWFSGETEYAPSQQYIGFMTPTGTVSTFTLADQTSYPYAMASADGDVWFIPRSQTYVGKVSPSGQVTEYPIPGATAYTGSHLFPNTVVAAPDGSVWVEVVDEPAVGFAVHITSDGTVTEYPPGPSAPTACASTGVNAGGMALGSDGAIWAVVSNSATANPGSEICRLSASGTETAFALSGVSWLVPGWMVSGPDDLLWLGLGGSLVSFDPRTAPAVVTTPPG